MAWSLQLWTDRKCHERKYYVSGKGGEKTKTKKTLTDTLWDKMRRWCAAQTRNKPIKKCFLSSTSGPERRESVKCKDGNLCWSRHNGVISSTAWPPWRWCHDALAVRGYPCEWPHRRRTPWRLQQDFCFKRERNWKQPEKAPPKKRWLLRWESTMCASKSDEEELLELDNWRRW